MNPFITHLNAPAEVRMSSNLSSHPNFNRSAYPFLLGRVVLRTVQAIQQSC